MKTSFLLHFKIFMVSIFMVSGFPGKALSDQAKIIDPEKQIEFAEKYFEAGDFDRAITEFDRFLFYFPDDERADQIRYQTGQAYFHKPEYEKALDIFKALVDKNPESAIAFSAYFDLSDCYWMLQDPYNAIAVLEQAAKLSDDPELQDKARYRMGWIFIETGQWPSAKICFDRISPDHKARYKVTDLYAALEEAKNLPRKNPALAGGLSVIPGGGYLYCGRPKDALIAFLLNTGLIWAAVEAFHNQSPVLGSVISFVEAGFYAGNIYGGISSAHKYNERKTRNFIDGLKKNARISLNADAKSSNAAFLFDKSF